MLPVLFGYLAGSVPFAFLLARRAGIDVRVAGSGNVGAANVLRTTGTSRALMVMSLDVAKGAAAVLIANLVAGGVGIAALTGAAAIVGHIYPVWLRFHGGKGVAVAAGVFSVLSPIATSIAAALFLVIVWLTRYVSLGSIAATLVSGPTEIDPTARVKSNIVGTGDFIPAHTYIQGDPFRIGGSVNLFGDQYADSGSWTDSEYDFTNAFTSTFSYSFDCNMVETVTTPATGHHEWTLDPSDPQAAACLAYDKNGLFQGEDQGQCVWIVDSTGGSVPEDRPPEAGTPINQDQTDTLSGHEYHGGPVQAQGGPFHLGQVVICISPSTDCASWSDRSRISCRCRATTISRWAADSRPRSRRSRDFRGATRSACRRTTRCSTVSPTCCAGCC